MEVHQLIYELLLSSVHGMQSAHLCNADHLKWSRDFLQPFSDVARTELNRLP